MKLKIEVTESDIITAANEKRNFQPDDRHAFWLPTQSCPIARAVSRVGSWDRFDVWTESIWVWSYFSGRSTHSVVKFPDAITNWIRAWDSWAKGATKTKPGPISFELEIPDGT